MSTDSPIAEWEVWLTDPYGERIKPLYHINSLTINRVLNAVGSFTTVMPIDFDPSIVRLDDRIEFWRTPIGGHLTWISTGIVRLINYSTSKGVDYLSLAGPDLLDILSTRIVAYAAGTAYTSKRDQACDMVKDIVKENLTTEAVDTARDLSNLGLIVTGYNDTGPLMSKTFAYKNVLTTLQEIAATAKEKGQEIFFDLVPYVKSNDSIGYYFIAQVDQLGKDKSSTSDFPLVFGQEWGNLENPSLTYDYTDECNYCYAGGEGESTGRYVAEVSNIARLSASPWNRREGFVDARNETDHLGVQDRGYAYLAQNKPRTKFTCDLKDTPTTRYNIDWNFGDKVCATYIGLQFDGLIRNVSHSVNEDGVETMRARLEVLL